MERMEKQLDLTTIKEELWNAHLNNKVATIKVKSVEDRLTVDVPLRRTGIERDGLGERWEGWNIDEDEVLKMRKDTDKCGNVVVTTECYRIENIISIKVEDKL